MPHLGQRNIERHGNVLAGIDSMRSAPQLVHPRNVSPLLRTEAGEQRKGNLRPVACWKLQHHVEDFLRVHGLDGTDDEGSCELGDEPDPSPQVSM